MCDYSILNKKTRNAQVGDKLVVTNFNSGTRGFAPVGDCTTAVCVKPGTELAFDKNVAIYGYDPKPFNTAIFRQQNKNQPNMHHDQVEFPDGTSSLLTYLAEGQIATVLQLPAEPKTPEEAREQERAEFVG